MPWENIDANMGRYGALWVAVQTAFGTPAAAPTHALRVRTFLPPTKQYTRTADEYADKSMESKFERVQGLALDTRSLTIEATVRDLALLYQAALGDAVTGTLTPKTGDFAVYAPGVPLTIWQPHPGGHTIAKDVQITSLELTVAARANVTAQIGLGITSVDDLGTLPAAPTISQEVLQFRHFWVKYDGAVMKPESGTVRLTVPMSAVDAAQGLLADDRALAPLGWERSGPRVARIEFATAGTPAALRTGYGVTDPANLKTAEAGFTLPGATPKVLSLKLNPAQVKGHDPSNGLDRFTVSHAIEGVSVDGLPPFSVTIPA
ncbi:MULTISPECIES: hypothetical protein [Deinococcus]|uniref:Uncharacterized protein n=1 Tax=Deinococcus rufus TaxID=2136097 RepID=A0ABV7ZDG1_9DEIO|nr:hypothetical protein [Deinococcus sp. AB2017081]WQE94041.1 hypothetical protein U2P90_11540 [Deinococcus sp. AB2017081]